MARMAHKPSPRRAFVDRIKHFSYFAAASLGSLAATPAFAGSLQVDPIKVEITAERKIAAVKVRNDGTQPVTIRGYALSWTQPDGEDVHQPASGVVVSPPVATIAPGGEQLVRVGLRSSATGAGAYRLIVEEVPEASPSSGVQVALRLSLPLFVMQKAGAIGDLSWSVTRQAGGKLALEAVNKGPGYVRIEAADAARLTGIAFDGQGSLGTVLPGSRRLWVIHQEPRIIDREQFDRISSGGHHVPTQTASKR